MTPDQQAFLNRLGITREELALAVQTCGVREYVLSRVAVHGTMNVYSRHASGKGVTRFGEEFDRLWLQVKKARK